MKKSLSVICLLSIVMVVTILCLNIFGVIGCSYKTRMLEYYTNDDVYKVLEGEILTINYYEEIQDCEVKIVVSTPNHGFPYVLGDNYVKFDIVDTTKEFSDLIKPGDNVVFYSAPKIFFDGHTPPIIGLKVNGEELISFETGKEAYLNWIKNAKI